MTQYRTKHKAAWDTNLECEVETPHVTVHEAEDGIPTGILDKDGNELFRYEKIKLGFV